MKRTELRRKKPWLPKPREPRTPPEKLVWQGTEVPDEMETRGCSSMGEPETSNLPMRVRVPSPPSSKLKRSRPKSTPARKAANGQPCLIRLPGCTGYVEGSVVLAHYRLLPYCGEGLKPPDELGAFGCDHCHGVVDGRLPRPAGYYLVDVRLAHAEGVMRTQLLLKDLQSK